MNTIRNIISHIRLPTIPRFSTNPPCEITTEFFFLCGHTVTSRRCHNDRRIWRDDIYFDAATACDETCPTRSLPYVIYLGLHCIWCRFTGVPFTNSIRSDPGVDVIEPAELQRRQEFYLRGRRGLVPDAKRAEWYRIGGKQACWETYKRLEHEWQDNIGRDWRERTYFVGGSCDTRLYIPIDRKSVPEREDEECQICKFSLWEGEPPIRLPCHATHRFHTDCLDTWLPDNRTCPACRAVYELSTYREWEYVYENRPFVQFFSQLRAIPDPPDGGQVLPQGVDAWIEPEVQAAWFAFMQE
jgi:hypothetical protein